MKKSNAYDEGLEITNYGYGWEVEDCEYSRTEARKRLKEYQENSCGRFSVRLVKRKERKV